MNPLLAGVLAGGLFFAGAAFVHFGGDDDVVSVECAAAHVAATFAQHEYGSSTNGIPNWETDEFRDQAFQEAFQRVKEACGGFDEPRDLWLRYGDLITEHRYAAIDHENPERRPWYREVICPTLDNPESQGLCTEES